MGTEDGRIRTAVGGCNLPGGRAEVAEIWSRYGRAEKALSKPEVPTTIRRCPEGQRSVRPSQTLKANCLVRERLPTSHHSSGNIGRSRRAGWSEGADVCRRGWPSFTVRSPSLVLTCRPLHPGMCPGMRSLAGRDAAHRRSQVRPSPAGRRARASLVRRGAPARASSE